MEVIHTLPYREKVIYIFTFVGTALALVFGISVHITEKNFLAAFIESLIVLIALANLAFYHIKKDYSLASTVILAIMVISLSFLLITGGYRGTGIFWIYTFPPLSLFLKNYISAILWNFLFISISLTLILLDKAGFIEVYYSFIQVRQALGAYTGVFFLSSFYSFMVYKLFNMLKERAVRDHLTGLYNRLFVIESLERIIDMVKRGKGRTYCLAYIDLDNFKYINDKFGHSEGDRVLKEIANFLRNSFRKGDIVGRIGGDEFLVLVYDCKKVNLERRLSYLRKRIEDFFKNYGVSFSYGIAEIPEDGVDSGTLLKVADKRMYNMKQSLS